LIKCNRLKANASIRVDLSYLIGEPVIKFLEVLSFRHRRKQKERIPDHIPRERFIYQFVRNHVFIVLKFTCHFFPELRELTIEPMMWMIEMVESLSNIIGEVIFSPFISGTVGPAGQVGSVEMNALANWERESFVRMQFVHKPCRHTIAAELLRD
jgi:hypothetical protein